jgi:glycosyltransferase involved in cell wall biosynthesis
MSRVDVFVPCYNYACYLRGCVESILQQERVQVRVLILDDASTDHTPVIGRALADEDGRVEYRRHTVNRGHIATYNEGIEWAEGDFTVLLSADDQLTPGALGRAACLLNRYSEVGLVYGRVIKTRDPSSMTYTSPAYYASQVLTGTEFLELCCTGNSYAENIVPTPTAVVRTTIQKQLGGYRKELPHTGDLEMWLRFAAHSSIGKIEADQAYYRFHTSNMHTHYLGMRDLKQRADAWDLFFQAYGGRLEHGDHIRRLSLRRIAEGAFWQASEAFEEGKEAECNDLLDFALSLDPSLSSWSSWQRLRLKRVLGPAVWGAIRPLVRRMTRTADYTSESAAMV